jgi:hypothetical protein
MPPVSKPAPGFPLTPARALEPPKPNWTRASSIARTKSCWAHTYPHLSGIDIGTLSALSRKQPNVPFGSLMPFALDPAGRPPSSLAIWPADPEPEGRCAMLFLRQNINVLCMWQQER